MISVQEGRGRQRKAATSLNFAALLLLKPQKTSLFPRQKQHDETDRPSAAVVYRMNCIQCDFVTLWPNRKITEDAGFRAQKDCLDVLSELQTCVPCPQMSSSHEY